MRDAVGIGKAGVSGHEIAVRPKIVEIFADVFQFTGDLHPQTMREDVARWDSLQHVALVAALESAYGIALSMDEMMEIASVGDIHAVLCRHNV
jgi:acyl carrier protein